MATLIKIDKNGTKYYAETRCPRCGGQGGRDEWQYTGYTCFDCGGTGIAPKPSIYKVYTPEYEAKLEAQRAKRREKKHAERRAKADELNADFLREHGIGADGKIYAVLGNTYEIREELKAAGLHFVPPFGWVSDHPLDRPTLAFDASEIYEKDADGIYVANQLLGADEIRQRMSDALSAACPSESEYVGEVGQRIETAITISRIATYEATNYFRPTWSGYRDETRYVYTMTDADGNALVWKTSGHISLPVGDRYRPAEEGDKLTIKGTIKEHSTYKGVKQTVLQRVKVI